MDSLTSAKEEICYILGGERNSLPKVARVIETTNVPNVNSRPTIAPKPKTADIVGANTRRPSQSMSEGNSSERISSKLEILFLKNRKFRFVQPTSVVRGSSTFGLVNSQFQTIHSA